MRCNLHEWVEKVAGQLDAAGAFLRGLSVAYPVVTGGIGGVLLSLVLLNLVSMPLRIAWWRFICWRNRLAGKLTHWSYDSDIADAIVAITVRYLASGRLKKKEANEKYRKLAEVFNLPELHPRKAYRPLHPYLLDKLREKTKAGIQALKVEKVKPDLGRKKVKLTIVNKVA